MKRPTHSEREKFVADLIRHTPTATAGHAQRLMRHSGTYHRLTEREEHGVLTPIERAKLTRVEAKIMQLCSEIRCSVNFDSGTFNVVMPDNFTVGVPGI